MYAKLKFLPPIGQAEVVLQRLPPGKALFDVVPPFELITFVGFPAKQDHPAITHRGKINQSLMIILQLNAEAFELARVS